MINSEKIAEYITNPQVLGYNDIANLDEIISKFPYCSTLHLLKLKAASSANSVNFESDLRYGAIHVSDREKMYYLLHSEEGKRQKAEELIEQEEIEQGTTVFVDKEDEVQIAVAEVRNEEDTVKKQEVIVQTEKISEEKIEKIIPEKKELDTNAKNEIDKAILPNLIERALENDLKSQPEKLVEPKKSAIKVEEIAKKKEVSVKKVEAVDLSKLSFVEWLKYKQGVKINEGIVPISDETEVEKSAETTNKSVASKSHIDDLLNKFISEEPSISRPKAEFFSPVKNAKKSLEESPDLVTETLAKIYFLQKNYTKAIHAYQQLILVYPEKKTFFASQIEKITEEQNK